RRRSIPEPCRMSGEDDLSRKDQLTAGSRDGHDHAGRFRARIEDPGTVSTGLPGARQRELPGSRQAIRIERRAHQGPAPGSAGEITLPDALPVTARGHPNSEVERRTQRDDRASLDL